MEEDKDTEAGVLGGEIQEVPPTDRSSHVLQHFPAQDEKNQDGQSVSNDTDVEKSPTAPAAIEHSNPLSKWRTIALVLTVTGAALMNTMSVQAAVIILPSIGRDLNIPAARQQWVVSAYALAFGCFLCLWGRLADVYGKKSIFVLGSAWVCAMTLICPFVPSEIGFDTFRGLQGLGAAANVPTAIGILGVTFPPGKTKTYAFATYSAGAPMGSVLGSILSGLVTEYLSWHWIFWILAALAGVTTIAGYFVIPLPTTQPSQSELTNAVDWIGGALLTISLFILLFALTEGNIVGWSQPYIIAIIVVSILLLAVFVAWQLYLEKNTKRRPLIKMSLFARTRVMAAFAVMALFFASFSNFLVFVTYFFQDYQGLSPLQTSLRFIPTGVAGLITIVCASQALARFKVYYIVIFGTCCLITSSLLFAAAIPPHTTYWAYGFPALCLCVMAADTLFPSLVLFNSHNLPREDQALGGALINAVGQTARAMGLALGTVIQISVQEHHQHSAAEAIAKDLHNPEFLAGLHAGQWFNVGMAGLALLVVVFGFKGAGVMK